MRLMILMIPDIHFQKLSYVHVCKTKPVVQHLLALTPTWSFQVQHEFHLLLFVVQLTN